MRFLIADAMVIILLYFLVEIEENIKQQSKYLTKLKSFLRKKG